MIVPGDTTSGRSHRVPGGRLACFGRILIVCIGGGLLGLLLAWLGIERGTGFGVVVAGPWTSQAQSSATEIDPYARAASARSGEVPLGAAEGLSFIARSDSAGGRLDPGCDYAVTGIIPHARYWTLSLHSAAGDLVANAADRYGFTSAEILRSAGGGFEIVVSRQARAGNWLPIGLDTSFVLVLRLYDTEIDMRSTPPDAAGLPRIVKVRCR